MLTRYALSRYRDVEGADAAEGLFVLFFIDLYIQVMLGEDEDVFGGPVFLLHSGHAFKGGVGHRMQGAPMNLGHKVKCPAGWDDYDLSVSSPYRSNGTQGTEILFVFCRSATSYVVAGRRACWSPRRKPCQATRSASPTSKTRSRPPSANSSMSAPSSSASPSTTSTSSAPRSKSLPPLQLSTPLLASTSATSWCVSQHAFLKCELTIHRHQPKLKPTVINID